MAESLAHRWGQIIGDGFEMFVRNILGEVAQREAFEVQVRFNTGAKIEATFLKRAEAIAFLRGFA